VSSKGKFKLYRAETNLTTLDIPIPNLINLLNSFGEEMCRRAQTSQEPVAEAQNLARTYQVIHAYNSLKYVTKFSILLFKFLR
jgi:hypothetical protein